MIIAVDLDDIPGDMHTAESARKIVQSSLENVMPHYNPKVHAIPTD
jgi:hypothetical protein